MNLELARRIVAEWLEDWHAPALVPREIPSPQWSCLNEILALVGPRRSGKTSLMFQWIADLLKSAGVTREDILFVDFEDYRLAGMTPADVDWLFIAFEELAGRPPTYLFFDEVQHLPEWSRVLRTLHNQRRYRILVSGSSSRLLAREVASELRGRYQDLIVLPFSFREVLRFKNIPWNERSFHTSARGPLIRAFEEYLREGGYPEILQKQTLLEQRKLAQNYFQTIFYRDILERYNIKAKAILEAMMRYAVDNYGCRFSISAFAQHLKAHGLPGSKRTISNYLRFFEEAFFLIELEKFSWSARKRLMNPKKVYLLDPVFSNLASNCSENRGRLLENMVAVELRRRAAEVYYYHNHRECDFVVLEQNRPALAIQVCWELAPANEAREVAGLLAALREYHLPHGLILTANQVQSLVRDGRSITVQPAWKWLLTSQPPEAH
jgi:predicted AAA+ superfamily ATPase